MNLGLAVSRATLAGVADTAVLLDAAAALGVAARPIDWRAGGWGWADVVLLHTPWDYTEDPAAFARWLTSLPERTRVQNPYELIAGNMHKSYLLDLADAGVPVPPTRLLRSGRPVDLGGLQAAFGDTEIVVKPAVGAGGRRLSRIPEAAALATGPLLDPSGAPSEDLVVQPFLPSVLQGEHSLVLIAGEPSHLVRKVPAAGEFRVQASYGGTELRVELDATAARVAGSVRPWVADLAYARVDYVLDEDGGPLVMELELTEPDLFLRHCPNAARTLVEHVTRG